MASKKKVTGLVMFNDHEIPVPQPTDAKHLYQVQLAFVTHADLSMDYVYQCAVAALMKAGLEPLLEYNHKVDNLTLRNGRGLNSGHGMQCIGVTGGRLPARAKTIKVARRRA